MQRIAVIAAYVLYPAALGANGDHALQHAPKDAAVARDAVLNVTINPEARITVKRGDAFPTEAHCDAPVEMPVRIINQAFVEAPLEVELVGNVPPGVTVEWSPTPLKGVPEETRPLLITLVDPTPVDLTVVFRAKNQIPNFGGTDHAHFVMRCVSIDTAPLSRR